MAKRKAGVNDIIYELNNDDIELSSDDEGMETKLKGLDRKNPKIQRQNSRICVVQPAEVINLDCSSVSPCDTASPISTQNGGKIVQINEAQRFCRNDDKLVETDKSSQNISTFHDNIIVDSPTSNSDLGVVGCENRTPLVTVRFKDRKFAHSYKQRVRKFLINLLKSQSNDSDGLSGDSDVELDIWPEDLFDDEYDKIEEVDEEFHKNVGESSLFFVDTAPCDESGTEIPKYSQTSSIMSNITEERTDPQIATRRGPTCFNCDGGHQLKDCPLPRNQNRIAAKRKALGPRVGRYHVEDEQKYGHLIPGRISGDLRHALGLKRYELPLHIYRMRVLGYPPGWLEEARISHSGITLFDSTGSAIQDPDEEEGEVCEPGSKDKFDIKKILDFPGFNVAASSRYIEEANLYGLPPISDQDSKLGMLQTLAPNAMKAYKRKKLTYFPSNKNTSLEGQAEMELDSGDEMAEFPSIPPLPDEEPPKAPPPPLTPPPEDISESPNKSNLTNDTESSEESRKSIDANVNNKEKSSDTSNNRCVIDAVNNKENVEKDKKNSVINEVDLASSDDELQVIEVVQVTDIPVPEDDLITIDDDDDDKSQLSSGPNSPSLDALEEKKKRLLDALINGDITLASDDLENFSEENTEDNDEIIETKNKSNETVQEKLTNQVKDVGLSNDEDIIKTPDANIGVINNSNVEESSIVNNEDPVVNSESSIPNADVINTPDSKTGQVKNTSYGTPVLNVASPFLKLPSDDKFAKNICDIINFENLPNSTGKFKKISSLLKKVKSAVDRIQDS